MWMLWVFFIAAAVLPIAGFARLLWRAQAALNAANEKAEVRGFSGPDRTELVSEHPSQPKKIRETRNAVVWDICLVGVGLVCGAVASIVALYV